MTIRSIKYTGVFLARPGWTRRGVLFALLIGVIAYLVLYPVYCLMDTSFQTNDFGLPVTYGLDNWRALFSQLELGRAIFNTLALSATRQVISVLVGVYVAWLIARTNLPGRRMLEAGFWIALYLPTLPSTMAWVLLLGGKSAVVNQVLMHLHIINAPIFNIYSWWGIIWVHLVGPTMAIKVFLLVPAFRALDSSLEEAARASGVSPFGTLWRVVVPIMMPTIIIVAMLGLIRSMQGFEAELILGAPADIQVYSTVIYRAMTQDPPLYGTSSALAISFLFTLVPFVLLQQWYSRRHSFATISGKFKNRPLDLGRARWPLFFVVLSLVLLMTVVPVALLLMGTFMKLFGIFNVADPWTLQNWKDALNSPDILAAFWNTLKLGGCAALIGMVFFTLIAYVSTRTKVRGRRALDFLTWLPALIPGLVLSLALLEVFTVSPLYRPLFGTLFVLVLAILISTLTVGSQIIRAALLRLGRELEEAGWAHGGSRLFIIRKVVIPLVAPSITIIGLEIFAASTAAVSSIALLATGANQPLSILQLNFLTAGSFESGSVVGFLVMLLTMSCALAARYFGERATRFVA